jgi:hypothetical protein
MQLVEREEIVRLPYELLPWQLAVKQDTHRNRAIHAGRRSGKTHLLCDLLIEAALTYAAGLPCWYVAPTYGMAKDIAWSLLKDFTADLLRAGLVTRYYETELRVDFRNGASIHLKGADNQDSLRGRGLGFLGIDEIALMHRDVWLRVLRPATSDYLAPVVFIGTPKGYNYFFDLCEMEKKDPAQWKTFHVKTSEAGTIAQSEINQARRDMDEQAFRQEYEASFEMFAGQIFHWDIGSLPSNGFKPDEIFYGGDFGYSVNPSVVVEIIRKADRFWVRDKIYQPGLTNQALGARMDEAGIKKTLLGHRAGDPVYFDAAEPKSIQELYEMGFNVIPAVKGPDSVRSGISFLQAQKITILLGAENIIREHRGYCWKADKNGMDLPEPMKINDHAMDAIRYAIATHMKQGEAFLGTLNHDVRPD